jgi:hypothetical protein
VYILSFSGKDTITSIDLRQKVMTILSEPMVIMHGVSRKGSQGRMLVTKQINGLDQALEQEMLEHHYGIGYHAWNLKL